MRAAILYYPVYFSLWIFTNTPLWFQYIFSDLAYVILYYLAGYRKKTVAENLEKSFPGKSPEEIRAITKKFYRHLCDYFIESVAIMGMSEKQMRKRFTYKNSAVLTELYNQGKSIIFATGHYGNWEWLASLPLVTPHRVLAIYKPLNNKHYDDLFKRLREKFGVHTIPVTTSFKYMVECHQQKIPTCTIFLTDQRPLKRNIEYWISFLSQETPVHLGTEKVGKKLDQAIVFGLVRKLKRGYYECECKLLFRDPNTSPGHEITESHVRELDNLIHEQPEYWLWSHKRWKHTRAKVEASLAAWEAKKQQAKNAGKPL